MSGLAKFPILLAAGLWSGLALAQQADVAFGGLKHDSTLPLEVTSDRLNVDQSAGIAVFVGTVLVIQGEMRLSADRVEVTYATDPDSPGNEINEILATGNVLLVNGTEAAEGARALYRVAAANIEMTGAVLLTQGDSAMSGTKLVIDLETGTGVMEGRVKTIFNTGARE